MVELDTHGCDMDAGYTWCDETQLCHIESTDPCRPIEPVVVGDNTVVIPPTPINIVPIVGNVQQPECEPIAGKPWECSGLGNFDRYDCINGKITFVEHNSTACGYNETFVNPSQTESNLLPLIGVLGLVLVGGFVMFGGQQ